MSALADLAPELRARWVALVVEQVAAGHWSAAEGARELRSVGFAASAPRLGAAARARRRGEWETAEWLVGRLARPLTSLVGAA